MVLNLKLQLSEMKILAFTLFIKVYQKMNGQTAHPKGGTGISQNNIYNHISA